MNLAEFLQQLTDEGMCVAGRYGKYNIVFELRMSPDGSGTILKWRPAGKRGSAIGRNPRLTLFKCAVGSVAELKAAAIAQIDRMIAAENARLEEEKTAALASASSSEDVIRLAAYMAAWDI